MKGGKKVIQRGGKIGRINEVWKVRWEKSGEEVGWKGGTWGGAE